MDMTRQPRAHQRLHQRWLRLDHGTSRVTRGRIVTDRSRLWNEGSRARVMELCWALHNVRVRLTPWQPMM